MHGFTWGLALLLAGSPGARADVAPSPPEERGGVTVVIEHPDGLAPVLSLYDPNDRGLIRPRHRFSAAELASGEVPAGVFLASLEVEGYAPDLHRVDWPPGSEQRLVFTPRAGWSVVIRALGEADEPIPDVSVRLRPASGYERWGSPVEQSSSTDRHGLVVFSGLTLPIVAASVEHAGQEGRLRRIAAPRGAFGYFEAKLRSERLGSVALTATLDGEPARGWSTYLLPYHDPLDCPATVSDVLAEGSTAADGTLRLGELAGGNYVLRLVPPGGSREKDFIDVSTFVKPGEEKPVDVELAPRRIYGKVARGDEPMPGTRLIAKRLEAGIDSVSCTEADEDGEYALTLWIGTSHDLVIQMENGHLVKWEWVWFEEEELERRVDVNFHPYSLEGRVLDATGQPVANVPISPDWPELPEPVSIKAMTDATGAFTLPLPAGTTHVELSPVGPQPADSERVDVYFDPDGPPPPPVTLTWRAWVLRGVVELAGAPMAHVLVSAWQVAAGGDLTLLGSSLTDADGRFTVLASPDPPTFQFLYAGPGCPLGALGVTLEGQPVGPIRLVCALEPANLELVFLHPADQPPRKMPPALRRGDLVIPPGTLLVHLIRQGLTSSGPSRWLLPSLAPGTYEIFEAPPTVTNGDHFPELPEVPLGTVHLPPGETVRLELSLDEPAGSAPLP